MRRVHNRSETARAVTLQHSSRDLDWQIGGKAGVTRYAARIFTALIRAADHDVFNLLALNLLSAITDLIALASKSSGRTLASDPA
jgi:hypothetical protein